MKEAQEQKNNTPQVYVSGEGKIKVSPNQLVLNVSIETKEGEEILTNGNNQVSYPMPIYKNMTQASMNSVNQAQSETIAIGEI
ncbi:MAG: hypothetical protein QM530_05015 [Phycisphaerales bacterium]|nr:hypothetical protein [Phycisphaerales bacterium]